MKILEIKNNERKVTINLEYVICLVEEPEGIYWAKLQGGFQYMLTKKQYEAAMEAMTGA